MPVSETGDKSLVLKGTINNSRAFPSLAFFIADFLKNLAEDLED
jgi:hypothetical protein